MCKIRNIQYCYIIIMLATRALSFMCIKYTLHCHIRNRNTQKQHPEKKVPTGSRCYNLYLYATVVHFGLLRIHNLMYNTKYLFRYLIITLAFSAEWYTNGTASRKSMTQPRLRKWARRPWNIIIVDYSITRTSLVWMQGDVWKTSINKRRFRYYQTCYNLQIYIHMENDS